MAPDARFFENLGPLSLGALAKATGASLADPYLATREIDGVAPLAQAGPRTVAFLSDRKRVGELSSIKAGAIFLTEAHAAAAPAGCAVLVTPMPQLAWAKASLALHRPRVHDAAAGMIHPTAEIEDGVMLGPNVVVGQGARIGRGTKILSAAVIGPGVAIGRDCWIGAYVSIAFALIGDRVTLLAGARIGETGFGVTASPQGLFEIPQLGRVILQDGVGIGANSSVDRGSFDDTVIGENSKLDNLVHIGHSSRLGRNCVAAAFTGLSGSVIVGDGVQFGGQAGITDHIHIGEGASVAGGAGVLQDIPAGEVWSGYPAKPYRQWAREMATVTRLTEERGRGKKDERG